MSSSNGQEREGEGEQDPAAGGIPWVNAIVVGTFLSNQFFPHPVSSWGKGLKLGLGWRARDPVLGPCKDGDFSQVETLWGKHALANKKKSGHENSCLKSQTI